MSTRVEPGVFDVVVIGGGQAALSVAYFLRRTSRSFVLLDAEEAAGGAWRHGWPSLRLFSPAQVSSLSGWPMPGTSGFPPRDHVIDYLQRYEARYQIPVSRPVWVDAVERAGDRLRVRSADRSWLARAVVSATGTWRAPFTPASRVEHSRTWKCSCILVHAVSQAGVERLPPRAQARREWRDETSLR